MSLDDMIRKSTKPGVRQGIGGAGGGGSGLGGGAGAGHNGGMRRMGGPQGSGVSKPGRSAFNQGRRHPQFQHGGRFGGRGGGRGQSRGEKDFWQIRRKAQSCFIEEATGDVVVQYHETIIVRISPEGDILLDSGGFHKAMTMASFNDVLSAVGVKVSAPEAGRLEDSQWLVSDGHSLFRFQDGMTLGSKGPHSATRGPLVLQAFNNPSAAAATFASNAVAAQVGLLPKNAPGVPLEGSTRGPPHNRSVLQGRGRFRQVQYAGGPSSSGRAVENRSISGGRGSGGPVINIRRGQPAEREWHGGMGGPDVEMGVQDEQPYEDEPFQQRPGGGHRSSGLEERYDLGGMRSQGWDGDAADDVIPPRHHRRVSPSHQQRRLYAQGRHM